MRLYEGFAWDTSMRDRRPARRRPTAALTRETRMGTNRRHAARRRLGIAPTGGIGRRRSSAPSGRGGMEGREAGPADRRSAVVLRTVERIRDHGGQALLAVRRQHRCADRRRREAARPAGGLFREQAAGSGAGLRPQNLVPSRSSSNGCSPATSFAWLGRTAAANTARPRSAWRLRRRARGLRRRAWQVARRLFRGRLPRGGDGRAASGDPEGAGARTVFESPELARLDEALGRFEVQRHAVFAPPVERIPWRRSAPRRGAPRAPPRH